MRRPRRFHLRRIRRRRSIPTRARPAALDVLQPSRTLPCRSVADRTGPEGSGGRKDALAHVGWWSDHAARVVTALRAGEVPYEQDPDSDIDAQNRAILEEFRDRDPAEVCAYEAAAFERLIAAVDAASDEDLFTAHRFPWLEEETLAEAITWDSIKHYPEHLPHLMA